MKRVYILTELENGWTITETTKLLVDGAQTEQKRRYIAQTLNEATAKVVELGAHAQGAENAN